MRVFQKDIESGKRVIVGINAFTGEQELEVLTNRIAAYPYDAKKRANAEKRQIKNLKEVKRNRNNQAIKGHLRRLKQAAKDERVNLIPHILEAVKSYATIGEICGVLREVFGEYRPSY